MHIVFYLIWMLMGVGNIIGGYKIIHTKSYDSYYNNNPFRPSILMTEKGQHTIIQGIVWIVRGLATIWMPYTAIAANFIDIPGFIFQWAMVCGFIHMTGLLALVVYVRVY